MPGKCSFQQRWLTSSAYKTWIERSINKPTEARCKLCRKSFEISNMGEAAVRSHMASKKHQASAENVRRTLPLFVPTPSAVTPTTSKESGPSVPDVAPTSSSASSPSVISSNEILSAEVLWTLKCVVSHYSFNSCTNSSDLFRRMFPDSSIAKHFSCGENKCKYIACFGIAPYCKSLVSDRVRNAELFVVLFDESHNKVTQNGQMDIHVRYWDSSKNQVSTSYCDSQFLGHSTADDLKKALLETIQNIEPQLTKILQVSMDGPNVNWKLHRDLCADIKCSQDSEATPEVINVGSCGLHIVHNAFRHGAESSEMDIEDLLMSLHWLFIDAPARRKDFEDITGTNKFPLKFCKHRWIENVEVIQRAQEIWPSVVKYVKTLLDQTKKYRQPSSKSYQSIKNAVKDPLIEASMSFFESVAKQLKTFLTLFQSDAPLLPFMCNELEKIVRAIMRRFVKCDVLKVSLVKLLKIDVNKREIHLDYTKVDIGFETEGWLKKAKQSKSVSELKIMDFRMKCLNSLKKVASKLMEKTPLTYSFARQMSCITPRQMANDIDLCNQQFTGLLGKLVDAKRVLEGDCDEIKWQFADFLSKIETYTQGAFEDFNMCSDRLDTLLYDHIGRKPEYKKLWDVIKMLLLLSHGQATVERGFSVNKQILVENLKEDSFIALRLVSDFVTYQGGLDHVLVTPKLLVYASSARHKYRLYLEEEKQKREKSQKAQKRRAVSDQLEEVKKKKKRLETEAAVLIKSADDFSEKAERTGQIDFISASNRKRREAKQKETEAKLLIPKINGLVDQVQQM